MKISSDFKSLAHEVKILRKLNKSYPDKAGIPKLLLVNHLEFTNNSKSCKIASEDDTETRVWFYIMPKYKMSLDKFLKEYQNEP